MEGCFTFQGGFFFRWGTLFLSVGGGVPHGGIGFDGGGGWKKLLVGGCCPHAPLTMGNPDSSPNPLTKFTSSSRSTGFKDILPWNIFQMITKTILISTRIVISYARKQGILLWIWWKVNGNWDNSMIRISQWKESHCRANTSIRRKK